MSSLVFVDTSFLAARLNRRDMLHAAAKRLSADWADTPTRFITTDAVLLEYANHFCASVLRALCIRSIAVVRAAADWQILPITGELMARAEKRYAKFADKEWSLTDCVSMEVMVVHRVKDVATADRHFAQAGFRVLLR